MAEQKAKEPKKTKDVVIHLPDTEELAASKMSQAEIEKLVQDIAGEKGSLKSARFRKGVPAVAVKSGARVARAFAAPGAAPGDPNGWIKTIWRRFC
jgi:hypothetical protein